ncbi:MAG: TRAP transporter large permease [Candidatus Methylomirabilia bacterium]
MLITFMLGLYVAAALGVLSLGLLSVFSDISMWGMFGLITWNTNINFVLVAIPLFVLMGELLLRSGLTQRLYTVISQWLNPLPGGLMHSNIAACAIFAAVSGSSIATSATIGSVALPAFRERGYDERLVMGSLAAGGTLGILIPPSINMIVYAVLVEESVGRLYIAGIFPGILLTLLFMSVIFLGTKIVRGAAPRESAAPWRDRLIGLIALGPTFILIFLVLGTIYLGVATPTEAAAFGVVGAFLLAALGGRINLKMLKEAMLSGTRTTAMIMLILTAAFILNFTLSILGVPHALSQGVAAMGLGQTATLLILIGFYLLLGTFMDGFAMMVTTIPVILPILKTQNIDLVWFGIIIVILTEAALISPPEGLNLYVIHGLRKKGAREELNPTIMDVYIGVLPFFFAMVLAIGIIVLFPQIALWLPSTMFGT